MLPLLFINLIGGLGSLLATPLIAAVIVALIIVSLVSFGIYLGAR